MVFVIIIIIIIIIIIYSPLHDNSYQVERRDSSENDSECSTLDSETDSDQDAVSPPSSPTSSPVGKPGRQEKIFYSYKYGMWLSRTSPNLNHQFLLQNQDLENKEISATEKDHKQNIET